MNENVKIILKKLYSNAANLKFMNIQFIWLFNLFELSWKWAVHNDCEWDFHM